jgi:hypothetical protein
LLGETPSWRKEKKMRRYQKKVNKQKTIITKRVWGERKSKENHNQYMLIFNLEYEFFLEPKKKVLEEFRGRKKKFHLLKCP